MDVGPIISSTRDVYVRKYRSLLAQRTSPAPPRKKTPPPQMKTPPPAPRKKTPPPQAPNGPTTPPQQRPAHSRSPVVSKLPQQPATPPTMHPAPPLTSAGDPISSRPNLSSHTDTKADAVVGGLLHSFNNWQHVANDTAFLFPNGDVIVASRGILATQCSKMIPILYNAEGNHAVVSLIALCREVGVLAGEVKPSSKGYLYPYRIAPYPLSLLFAEVLTYLLVVPILLLDQSSCLCSEQS